MADKPLPKGTAKVRTSKYRHLFGTPTQNAETILGVQLGSVQIEANLLKVNPQFLAVPWSGDGVIAVIPTNTKGAVSHDLPLIVHDENTINDFAFNPFNDNLLATATQTGSIFIWRIPEGGLTADLTKPTLSIPASEKRLLNVDFHNLASNVLVSIDAGKVVKLWDIENAKELQKLPDVHKGLITNISWNREGSLVSTSCKDKFLRIIDPRANKTVAETSDHQGAKGSRVVWLPKKNFIFSCGFSKGSERQLSLHDPRKLDQKLTLQTIDNSSSTLLPFYDDDNGILFLGGKGDGNIRFYEVTDSDQFVYFLSEFKSKEPQSGLAAFPKQSMDVMKCETMRLLKITPQGQVIPIRFEIPRQENVFFQDDIFPDTWDGKPSMTAAEWNGGANNPPKLMSLNPEKRK